MLAVVALSASMAGITAGTAQAMPIEEGRGYCSASGGRFSVSYSYQPNGTTLVRVVEGYNCSYGGVYVDHYDADGYNWGYSQRIRGRWVTRSY
ncbi:MAG: hypothetical protein L0K86_11640 [Actinomycetia bacterium]|nr:hypothetical protein [Actinomycetes bacterium]